MSFDLVVSTPRRPDPLREPWEREFLAHGFYVEIWPSFDPATWEGGFLPFRLVDAPAELIGMRLDAPVVSGFEVGFEVESAHFRTAMGRTTAEFALQCFGAATLAILSGGLYVDDQNGIVCDASEAIAAARKEVESFCREASGSELATRPFPGWAALE